MKHITFQCILIAIIVFSSAVYGQSPKGKFEIGSKTFLFNGEPFVVKAAELHYPRIPKEYWDHRIKMCKSLGMNTICLYIFWNIHEQKEGSFDFSGQNDIAAFCKLAQNNGMWVIVRPGPYVCAEWEMGGLPWWLLKKKDVALRSLDPYFIDKTRIYMKQVGKELSDLQTSNGGNIIMVQVENEFGAYGIDKEYVRAIKDIVIESGFDSVPLFQCDWTSNFENNALDELLWTINFGSGANVDQQFKRLEELRPTSPLMCSEYWSGWFDHWGRKHETRTTESLLGGLEDMMKRNISFSLYMAHGGTTFGHWGGANSPVYSAMCSSYDYDAPINESGKATPKYFALRKLLANYLDKGEMLPPIPDSINTISIPKFSLDHVAPLLKSLPPAVKHTDIIGLEDLDQGWGSVLYRTKVKQSPARQLLLITEMHDWAQIYINGVQIGTLDRRKGENSLLLPPVKDGDLLDIFVEAMGRVNFNKNIHDRKGITQKVELINDKIKTELKNWDIFCFPVDYSFAKGRAFKKSRNAAGTQGYYKGQFILDKVGDTFLDMRSWGKGMVWVNGHAMGRFWEIGPQQTLYMPGCWLKEGENEIIVMDISGPKENVINGLRDPILDMLRVKESPLHKKEGELLDLTKEKPISTGTFKEEHSWQRISFNREIEARYLCLEMLNSYGKDDYASIAELEVLDKQGNFVSRQNWKIVYASSEEVVQANNSADKIHDYQESTFWHTKYSTGIDKYPHHLVIDFGKNLTISGFAYLPRVDITKKGLIKDYNIFVKESPFQIYSK